MAGQSPERGPENSGGSVQPHCIFCGESLQLTRVEPSADEGYDRRSFDCPRCANTITAKVPRD